MYLNFYNERNDFFSIIAVSLLFHSMIIVALLVAVWLRPPKEDPKPIPFFEMINVAPPPSAPAPQKRVAEPTPQPAAEPTPVAKPELKPEVKPEIKPETKPSPAKPESKPTHAKPAEPSMDMPMDLPSDIKSKDMDMPALRMLGSVIMDSQLQAYLNTLNRLLRQNFNPPAGTEISSGTKSSVQFQIARNGEISEVVLRSSSGNAVWDRLAVRAVQITKPPPLPPNFAAENLPLIFDFREK